MNNYKKNTQSIENLDITEVKELSLTEKVRLRLMLICDEVKYFSRTEKGRKFWLVFSFVFGGIPGGLLYYFRVEKKNEKSNDNALSVESEYKHCTDAELSMKTRCKLYKDKEFRGLAQESIRLMNTIARGQELLDLIKTTMEIKLSEKQIPAKVVDARIKSGGAFNGEILPMVVIQNTEPGNKYFHIGIIVNEDSLIFPLLGESKENTRNNRSEFYKKENTMAGDLKSALYSANQFKLQREVHWRDDVIACFNENLS